MFRLPFRVSLPLSLLVLSLALGSAFAQTGIGYPKVSAFDHHEVDTINLQNLNIALDVPLMSKSGAFPLRIRATGNYGALIVNGAWMPTVVFYPMVSIVDYITGNAQWTSEATVACPGGAQNTNKFMNWVVNDANGTVHPLPASDFSDSQGCLGGGFTDLTTDGSAYKVTVAPTGAGASSVYLPNGMLLNGVNATDSNGNSEYFGTGSLAGRVIDTLGLSDVQYAPGAAGPPVKWTDVNSGTQQITFTTSTGTIQTNFGCSGGPTDKSYAETYPTSINLPDGTSLGLSYEPTPSHSPNVTGRLYQLTLREGGTVSYRYSGGSNGINCIYGVPPTLKRTTGDGMTEYDWAAVNNGGGNWGNTTTVTDAGGNVTIYTFTGLTSSGLAAFPVVQALTEVQHKQGSSTLLSTDYYCYNTAFSSCSVSSIPAAVVSLPITSLVIFRKINGMSNMSATEKHFDSYGNVTYSAAYDFGGSTPTQVVTSTYGSCSAGCTGSTPTISAVSVNVNDKPGDVLVSLNGNKVAESRFTYDSHGNFLTRYVWTGSSWLYNATANSYNTNGTISASYDLANNQISYGYSHSSYTGCGSCTNYPFPTSISKGGLTTNLTWNGIGGVKLTDVDANGNTTSYCYNTGTGCSGGTADPFWRILSVTDPLGYVVYLTYPSGSSPDAVNSSFTFNSGNSIQNTTVTTDGYGRAINLQTQQSPTATNYDTVSTTYNWSTTFRTIATSQPCSTTVGQSCTTVHTNYLDPLSRLYQETTTSNETLTHTYTQNDDLAVLNPAPSGEHVKSVQKEFDGLGRLQSVCGIMSSGGYTSCTQNAGSYSGKFTTYAYASATGSTTISRTRGSQTRSRTVDGLGRLLSETNPENGTSSYTYDTDSTCGTSTGDLVKKVDNAGNTSCYSYDALHRVVTIIIYKSGVCTPPVKRFRYDNTSNAILPVPSGYSGTNTSGHMVEAWTGDCVWPTPASGYDSATDEWFAYSNRGENTDLWESTTHVPGYYHGTASYAANGALSSVGGVPGYTSITYGLDGEGRLSTAIQGTTNLTTGVTYTGASQPQAVFLGTGDSDNYVYDQNTGRMKNYAFSVNGTTESGGLTWSQNGTLGQLAITDHFNSGGTQTCNYGYDDLARLVSDNCGSVGGQTFTYDQYDNLTTSANGIGVSWNPGYDSNTNHALAPITYDSNGNLTNDTFFRYAWYVDNKLGSTDSTTCNIFGSTDGTCILYDALGREVERGVNGVYTEVMYTPVGKTAIMNGQTTTVSAYFPLPGGTTYYQTSSTNGSGYFWHKDWLGSARLSSSVLNRTVYFDRAFAPYGEMYNNFGNTTGLNFTGDTQDSFAGLLYDTPNRELHPGQGRWISPDPAGAGWNLYAYSTNPNSFRDPLGLGACSQIATRAGAHPNTDCQPCTIYIDGGYAGDCGGGGGGEGGGGGGLLGTAGLGGLFNPFDPIEWGSQCPDTGCGFGTANPFQCLADICGYMSDEYIATHPYDYNGVLYSESQYQGLRDDLADEQRQALADAISYASSGSDGSNWDYIYGNLNPYDQNGDLRIQGGHVDFTWTGDNSYLDFVPGADWATGGCTPSCRYGGLDAIHYNNGMFHLDTVGLNWGYGLGAFLHGLIDFGFGNINPGMPMIP
jgi:RHS repeat-associated protein